MTTTLLILAVITVCAVLIVRGARGGSNVEVPVSSARVDATENWRRSGAGMPTLPSHVARMDNRPGASFSQPAAKGFERSQQRRRVVKASVERKFGNSVKPWNVN
jgi:hypothetical protein